MTPRCFFMLCASGLLTACGPVKLLESSGPFVMPTAQVTQVQRLEVSAEASRLEITVDIENPNTYPVPMTDATYELQVNQIRYRSLFEPNTTLPASGRMSVVLPAVLPGVGADHKLSAYNASGSIGLEPPEDVGRLLARLFSIRPRVGFAGQGDVTEKGR